ncbi:MAG: NRDE family protein [Polyangiaceae bacterium]
MCTLVAFIHAWQGVQLVIAANRDERLDRAASGPTRWVGERFFAPRDDQAGGTWLGLHDSGLFVGVTNRAGSPRDAALVSRGQLVVDALRLGSATKVHEALSTTLAARRYNPFHLLYADRDAAFVTWFDGNAVRQAELARGLTVVTERSLGGDDHGREERVRRQLEPSLARSAPPALEELAPTMRDHVDGDPLASTCVHVPALGYGTRSSLLLEVSSQVGKGRWLWADGPPCSTPYEEMRATA